MTEKLRDTNPRPNLGNAGAKLQDRESCREPRNALLNEVQESLVARPRNQRYLRPLWVG